MLLTEFSEVVTAKLGLAKEVKHKIVTSGDTHLIRSYRLAPGWRTQLKQEIDKLLELGVLVPSCSPWYSPMVPLCNKDLGALRLCINCRKLNLITQADPYQMPLIKTLLDNIANAHWLT